MKQRIYIWLYIAITLLLLFGCRSVEYVPVVTERTDSVYITVHSRDSVHVRDSVRVTEKGDTVFSDRWRTVYRDRVRTDTVHSTRTDSIRVPYPVERRLTRWEKIKMECGGLSVCLASVLAVAVIWMAKKKGGRGM